MDVLSSLFSHGDPAAAPPPTTSLPPPVNAISRLLTTYLPSRYILIPTLFILLYLYALNVHLSLSNRLAYKHSTPLPSQIELRKTSYRQCQSNILAQLSPPKGSRYLVTGGSGLVGSHIVRLLLQRGERPENIRVFDRVELPEDLRLRGVGFVRGDLGDAGDVERAVSEPFSVTAGTGPNTGSPNLETKEGSEQGSEEWEQVDVVKETGLATLELTESRQSEEERMKSPKSAGKELQLGVVDEDDAKVEVVYHTGAAIRYWERSAVTRKFSYDPNVKGTSNLLESLRKHNVPYLIYTSSNTPFLPRGNFLRFKFGWIGKKRRETVKIGESLFEGETEGDAEREGGDNWYVRTKREAERLVREADDPERERGGLRTTVLRPGSYVLAPHSLALHRFLSSPSGSRLPTFANEFIVSSINAWDLACAELTMEDALRDHQGRAERVAGKAFFVKGDQREWKAGDWRRALKVLSKKKEIEFVEIPALPLYILAHLVEAFVTFCLLLHSFVYTQPPPAGPASENDQKGKKRERVEPSSPTSFKYDPMGYIESILGPDLRILQPATFEIACVDCVLDDSKFREVTGFKHSYSNAQTLKGIVDEYEKTS